MIKAGDTRVSGCGGDPATPLVGSTQFGREGRCAGVEIHTELKSATVGALDRTSHASA
jgi:hypothetical protein